MSKRIGPKDVGAIEKQVREHSAPRSRTYDGFNALNGLHPFQMQVPEGYILYPVRKLARGNIVYFNFGLAKEMGLIPENHPHELNEALIRMLIDTFAIQIVNEFDQGSGTRIPKESLKANHYMATRYLQLQHPDKRGRTSGDGRSVWNGTVTHKNQTWDVSSRGTGVTALAPGSVEANRPLKSGSDDFGYGCGMAELDELYGSSLMSEIFHFQGVPTERMLVIIDIGKNLGIGVRAAPNLLRPAHLFLYLKQHRQEPLKRATDYFISRQVKNGMWNFSPESAHRYDHLLTAVCESFAKFAANLERNYIFAWMDWDGDNVLANGGIIDYGSIRQFGLRHDQYRYDDIQRFSTNLNEQVGKARLTVQVFAQMVTFIKTGKRKSLKSFKTHPVLKKFDEIFERELRLLFLRQIGLDETQALNCLNRHRRETNQFYRAFSILERTKTKAKLKRVPDGVNRPAVFNMRAVLRELPSILKSNGTDWASFLPLKSEVLMPFLISRFASRTDQRLSEKALENVKRFQLAYLRILELASESNASRTDFIKNLKIRAEQENLEGRITGNGAEYLIDEIIKARKRGMSWSEVQRSVELFVYQQTPRRQRRVRNAAPVSLHSPIGQLFQRLLNTALEFQEDI